MEMRHMAGSIVSEWRNAWFNNPHRVIEFNTLSVNNTLAAVGQETGMIDIPQIGQPIFAIRLRLNGNFTTDANAVRLATNVPGRAFDVRIFKPDGKALIWLQANGGVRLHTIAPAGNDTISPGDVVMFSELFVGKAMAHQDRVSGRLGPQTANGDVYCDIVIPCYIPADAGTHKLQLRNATFTWAAGTGTIYAANPANVPAVSTWTLELIEECLPAGATMSYFGVTNPQSIALAVGDNFIQQNLNRGKLLKMLIIQTPLPANTDDIVFAHNNADIIDTEMEDLISQTGFLFDTDFADVSGQAYGLEEFAAGAAIVHSPHRNVAVILPGDLVINDTTRLKMSIDTAAQTIRMIQCSLEELPRVATTPEIVSSQPAPATPVVAVAQNPVTGMSPRPTRNVGGGRAGRQPGILSAFMKR